MHCAPHRGTEAGIAASLKPWLRPLVGAAVLGVLVQRLGADGFVQALDGLDAVTLLVGSAIAALTTACSALRWRTVARQLRVDLPWRTALAACYRSQFLNVSLPGGVLGDVDRGVHHGRTVNDVARGLRAVVWERALGQVVLVVATVAALLAASPFGSLPMLVVAAGAVTVLVVAFTVLRRSRVAAADVRALVRPAALTTVVVTSVVAVAGYVATLALAAHAVGLRMPSADFVPLALLVLLAAAVPLNLAGWGPREGAAAWAFGAAGATADKGLAVAVAFGVIVVVGTLPGAVLVLLGRRRRTPERKAGGRHTGMVDIAEVSARD